MHIEKNVCQNIIDTLLDTDGKSKDNLNARFDIQELGIRSDLHLVSVEDNFYLPPTQFTMSPDGREAFLQVLKEVKFLDGYASNMRCNVQVRVKKLIGLKSHGNYVLLQDLLPITVLNKLPERVSAALIRVSNFVKKIYSPTICISDMQN
jgi:hypothetical protein